METERVTEFPMTHLDRRPRKRARLGWDVLPEQPKAHLELFCGQAVGNLTSYTTSRQPTDLTGTLVVKGRNGSPPWRNDGKDGHYTFELGENLTSRCNYLLPPPNNTIYYLEAVVTLTIWSSLVIHENCSIHCHFTKSGCTNSKIEYKFSSCLLQCLTNESCLLCFKLKKGVYQQMHISNGSISYEFVPRYNLYVTSSRSYFNVDKIHSKMGEGTFGQVLECWDREKKEMVAIKIVRGIKKYREAAMIEIEMLQQLGKHDKAGNCCVQIRNWFDYCNHICIVFEKLGPSLYDFLRKNNYSSFPIDLVREIGRQLLECVAFMHDLRLIHTDLKPENILLVSPDYIKVPDYKFSSRSPKDSSYYKRVPKSSAIKVIDFGSTIYDRQDQKYIVSTRHYRAPEVILGLGWRYACDIWSVGCILVELYSGEALFQTHENLEHLAMMERVFGPLPQHMLKRVYRQADKYVRRGRLDWPEGASSRDSIKAVLKLARLENIIMEHVDDSAGDLVNLLQGLLRYDPSERLTAREALRHPFFTRGHLSR